MELFGQAELCGAIGDGELLGLLALQKVFLSVTAEHCCGSGEDRVKNGAQQASTFSLQIKAAEPSGSSAQLSPAWAGVHSASPQLHLCMASPKQCSSRSPHVYHPNGFQLSQLRGMQDPHRMLLPGP